MVGLRSLPPTINVIEKIIAGMKEGAQLDADAQRAVAEVMVSYVSVTPQAHNKIAEAFMKHSDTLDKNSSDRLYEQWNAIMAMPLNSDDRSKLASQAR